MHILHTCAKREEGSREKWLRMDENSEDVKVLQCRRFATDGSTLTNEIEDTSPGRGLKSHYNCANL